MTEQQAGVATVRFEFLLTDGAAGVRNEPRVRGRVLDFTTVTQVPVWRGTGWILCSAFRARPRQLFLSEIIVCD